MGDQGTGIRGRERYIGVIGTEMGHDYRGIRRFVEARFSASFVGESDRETAHRPAVARLQQSGYQRRIHPTGEEGTEGYIRQGLLSDHLLESALEPIENIGL